jgi:hypothetical protein
LNEQLLPAPSDAPHVLLTRLYPVGVVNVKDEAAMLPELDRVTVVESEACPTWTLPNPGRVDGLNASIACCPVAARDAVLLPPPVATVSVPERAAVEVGLNCTVTTQEPPAVTVEPQVVDTNEKSVPLTEPEVGGVTLSVPMPVFVRVAEAVEFAPTEVAAKLGVESVADWACPVPESEIFVTPAPSCNTARVPGRLPAAVGVNATSIAQEPPAGIVLQLLLWA